MRTIDLPSVEEIGLDLDGPQDDSGCTCTYTETA